MPVERVTGRLPRWVTDPRASDWVSGEEVLGFAERERAAQQAVYGATAPPGRVLSHEDAGRHMAHLEAFYRFLAALDIAFGPAAWPGEWVDGPMPWDAAPGGPPADLVAAVSERRAARTGGTEPGVPGPPGPEGPDD